MSIANDDDGVVEDNDVGYMPVMVSPAEEPEPPTLLEKICQSPGVSTFLRVLDTVRDRVTGKEPLPEWLVRSFDYYGRKQTYTIQAFDFEEEYPDLWSLVQTAIKNGTIEGRSSETEPNTPGSTPNDHLIILKPATWERLKEKLRLPPGRKTNARQVTVAGKEFDLRNSVNYALIHGRIEDVQNVTESYLHQLRQETTKRQRRRLLLELHRVMLLRGKELSRPLYGSMCLRLGMPLPADFWHLPPEMLPKSPEAAAAV